MDKSTHSNLSIKQSASEDLTINQEQAAEIKGGVIRSGNTYTGTTEIREGVLN